jgi:hypothetical protein
MHLHGTRSSLMSEMFIKISKNNIVKKENFYTKTRNCFF